MGTIVFDLETTDASDDAGIVQAAWIEVSNQMGRKGDVWSQYYDPGKPISYGAMATHHIVPSDLIGMPSDIEFALPDGLEYLVGHNVDFDWRVAGKPSVRRICTLALARKVWPEIDSHALGAVAYFLLGEDAREIVRHAHGADIDVELCLLVAKELFHATGARDVDDFWRMSEEARVPDVMPFGKHKGILISQVPRDYKDWLLRQDDVDPYLVEAIRRAY